MVFDLVMIPKVYAAFPKRGVAERKSEVAAESRKMVYSHPLNIEKQDFLL